MAMFSTKKPIGKSHAGQSGIAVIMVVVVIAIIAALWLSSKHGVIIGTFKNKEIDASFQELKVTKERLLQFAALTPELYYGVNISATVKPPLGPGYLPCPDNVDGSGGDEVADWATCSTGSSDLMLSGKLPRSANNTASSFSFAEANKYLYYVDKRYVLPSLDYTDDSTTAYIDEEGLYSPLTPVKIEADANGVGGLSLNGAAGIIAIIIDPGSDNVLSEVTISGTDFTYLINDPSATSEDPTIDKLVAINYEQDWLPLIARRVCREKAKFTNDYSSYIDNDGDGNTDPVYSGYDLAKTLDDWKMGTSWYYWADSDESWYKWSSACP